MKLTLILCMAAVLQVTAGAVAQTITFSGKDVSLEKIFSAVKAQTGYGVFYDAALLESSKPVTVSAKEQPLQAFLGQVLAGQALDFSIKRKTIFIRRKPAAVFEPVVTSSSAEDTSISVTGKVTDGSGNAVPGATILVKGEKKGTNTDAVGTFTLADVSLNAQLIISSIGYESRVISVKGKSINVKLNVIVNDLDETVVIAYGTTTKRYNTGNVSTVKAKQIAKQPINNPLLALQGRVPGLFITQSTGLPGSGISVRIQGQNSINYGNDPLYVIDGVPYTSQLLPSFNGILGVSSTGESGNIGSNYGNPLSFINPADIESIDVLKDADATAIYGSRAANGAILITTKKGKPGEAKVDVNVQHGWGRITRKLNLLNTQQYLEMRHEAIKNDKVTLLPTDYDINGTWDTTRNTDWQRLLIGGTAKYTDAQVSISGGNDAIQYLVGAGYHRETTVFPGNLSDQKGSLHFNISSSSRNHKLKFQLSGDYLVDNNRIINRDLTEDALRIAPNAPAIYSSDGSINWASLSSGVSTWRNPLAYLDNRYKNRTNNLIGNAVISYQVVPGLEIKSSFGYTSLQSKELSVYPLTSVLPEERPNTLRSSLWGDNSLNSWIIEPQLSYKLALKKGKIEVLIGTTFQRNASSRQELSAEGFNSDLVLEDIKSAAVITPRSTIISVYKYNALFGRVNYNWQDKYIINLTARRDGSSRFGPQSQLHNFGAIGGAWIFSKEAFFARKMPVISFGKLRASYGTTGNDQIGDYQFMNLYRAPFVNIPYQGATGLAPDGLPNPYLEWEETKKLQFGMDIGLLADRFLFNVSYFHNRSSNQLLPYELPTITGFPNIATYNFPATVQNSGWELSLTSTNISVKDFNWTSNINFTIPKNKLIEFSNLSTSSYAGRLFIGEPITLFRAYRFSGVNSATGVYQFIDNHGSITPSPDYIKDADLLINTAPDFYGGIQNSFSYKGFELDVLFQFVKQLAPNYIVGNFPGLFSGAFNLGNQPSSVLQRWRSPGDLTTIQRYSSNYDLFQAALNARSSNAVYTDASYVRLKNLSLSWRLPGNWRKRIKLQNCRLYIQGQNLLTITNYIGLDPETKSSTSLPPLKVLTVGMHIIM